MHVIQVETAPLTLMIARKAVSETKPEVSRKIEVINQPQFSDILKADNAPEFGEYETVSSKFYEAVQQQELVKEVKFLALKMIEKFLMVFSFLVTYV